MGGALTIAAAVHVPGLAAAVCFYGIPPVEFADPARIRIPFQAHFANKDDWCTPAAVDALEAAMKAAGAQPEVYDAACANLAWERMLPFLAKHLS